MIIKKPYNACQLITLDVNSVEAQKNYIITCSIYMITQSKFKISPRVFKMLSLKDDEEILFCMKISTNPFYKNEQKDARILWIGTKDRLIFLDYYRIPILPANVHAYIEKDMIPLSQITGIIAHKKKFTLYPSR